MFNTKNALKLICTPNIYIYYICIYIYIYIKYYVLYVKNHFEALYITMPKELQYLSKRRKNQMINRELSYYKHSKLLYSTNLNITSNTIQAENNSNSNFTNIDDTIILTQDFNETSESSVSDTESLSDR